MSTAIIISIAVVAVFLGLIVYSHFKTKNAPEIKKSENISVLNAKNFKAHTNRGLVLVDFWAAWCNPCKMLAPILNEIADDSNLDIKVAKLNVDQFQQVASKMKVRSLPTIVVFKDGKEVDRIVGVKTKKAILKELEKYA